MEKIITVLTDTLGLSSEQIETVLDLTAEGNTIPFIARYRKEMTGHLDEVTIKAIVDQHKSLTALEERKQAVLSKIDSLGKLTAELKMAIAQASKLAEVEELYLPFKEKRRTKATVAREAGLLPLARLVLQAVPNLEQEALAFTCDGFETVEKAISGACDILIEALSEDTGLRSWLYQDILKNSVLVSAVKDESLDDKATFEIYYDFSEKIINMTGYRTLALNRGESLGVLKVSFHHDIDKMIRFAGARFKVKTAHIDKIVQEAVKKKILPSLERRIRTELTEQAEDGAIALFSENLRNLLLIPPLKGKIVLGFDPAYRTGAKLAVVDQTGKLLTTTVIFPVKPASSKQIEDAKLRLSQLIRDFQVEIVAIGNGTASRESEAFVAEVLKEHDGVSFVIVNESGASVYSASDLARQEFPDLTVEKRSAISIARRLQDPLAELVKIDPKSIGVGQYQHDVSQKKLSENLDFIVETVVNQVGVNVNTASSALLSHVAGLNKTISENIVAYREENGPLTSRQDLKKVPRLGAKAFEQSAGFLRIPDAENMLDRTGVHPEAYSAVEQLLTILSIQDLNEDAKAKLSQVKVADMAKDLQIGEATLTDIIADLMKPGRDLRDHLPAPVLRKDVLDIRDLVIGQQLEGTVRNVVDFGAFVDVGLHNDGLIHISQMSKTFIKHPRQVLSLGDLVTVWVSKIDVEREKLNLSLVPLDELDSLR